MENNCTKKLFGMNKFFVISFFIVVSLFFVKDINAISGACSSHSGVNCSMGRQLNGKVHCNDGWTESVADYDFMVACKNYKYSCNTEEWNGLSQKYSLENLFSRLQNIIDNSNSNYFFQIQYNAVKNQYDSALNLAERECEALGADRASQQNYERMQSDLYNTQIKNEQDKLAQLEQEKQKLTENYLNELNNLNTPQYTCPANSTLNGTICPCNDGYVSNGSACITYTQNCQAKYGVNSYGDKNSCTCASGYVMYNNQCTPSTEYCKLNYGDHTLVKIINGTDHCDCEAGYVWNSNTTACIKIEVKPATPPLTIKPTTQEINDSKKEAQKIAKSEEKEVEVKPITPPLSVKPVIQKTGDSKEEVQKITKPAEKLIVKNEPAKKDTLTISTSEKTNILKEKTKKESKSGFFVRVFGSIKNFFSNIFR